MKKFITPIVFSFISSFCAASFGAILVATIEYDIFNLYTVGGMVASVVATALYGITASRLFMNAAVDTAEEE